MLKHRQKSTVKNGDRYAIDIVALSKQFNRSRYYSGSYTTLKSMFTSICNHAICSFKRPKTAIPNGSVKVNKSQVVGFALNNLTLRVPRGAAVGIVGRNGSGKSTLLKLISGIYRPDSGSISVNGRIAALIELGAGFHPEFSGRENVYLAGAMYGLSRKEIDRRFNHIVDFAELSEVIDEPVRTYSSGMFMRLGFSLAVHTNPDILIVDEVLAVGDAAFSVKCEDRIAELKRSGKTLLLVTHDLDAVLRWCDEALWLDKGVVKERGEPRRVLDAYRSFIEKGEDAELLSTSINQNSLSTENNNTSDDDEVIDQDLVHQRWGSREVEILGVVIKDGKATQEQRVFHPHDAMVIEILAKANSPVSSLVCGIAINRTDGVLIIGTNTQIEDIDFKPFEGIKTFQIKIENLGINCGSFTIDVALHDADGYPFDYHRHIVRFAVRGESVSHGATRHGVVSLPISWMA
jgi:ABC-type polysaccharide/polyol phosphate transport system ATPase subunit